MQRLIVCCDGSWRDLDSVYPSNVIKMAQSITEMDAEGNRQTVFYGEGIGSNTKSKISGILGLGVDDHIMEGYKFLAMNYHPGDEIYLFGFSRGAYVARSIAGMIYCSGLVDREHMRNISDAFELYRDTETKPSSSEAIQFRKEHGARAPIEVLGCWDTVGALGIPFQIPGTELDDEFNERFAFHDTCVNPSVRLALHAKAIDEHRALFEVTPMHPCKGSGQIVEEVWFPGDHSCIGGGKIPKAPMSNRCLLWMMERMDAHKVQLARDLSRVEDGVECDHSIDFDNRIKGMYKFVGSKLRPIDGDFDQLDRTVKRRWRDRPDYRPENLAAVFEEDLDNWSE